MQADNEDFELKQMRDMAATKKRWDALVCYETESERERDLLFYFTDCNVLCCI